MPIVNQAQVEGLNVLNERGNRHILMVMGHLKSGVTPAQAVADLNAVGAYLEKTYPKDDGRMTFSLTRPYLAVDWLGDPVREFMAALMLLAGLILLAARANIGSLFAARAADRGRAKLRFDSRLDRAAGAFYGRSLLKLCSHPDRRCCRTIGQHPAFARAECVASASRSFLSSYTCRPGRKGLRGRSATGPGERFPLWRCAGETDTAHASL